MVSSAARSGERFAGVSRHTYMNRTTDLDDDMDFTDRELSTRLAATAELMPVNPDALAEVRSRAGQRRRMPARLLVASAAAVVAVVALVGMAGRDTPAVEIESASGASSDDTSPAAESTPVPKDGVLLVFDYPNSDDPDLAGEWTTLNTSEWSYHWRGAPDSLARSGEQREENRMALFLDIIDSTASAPPADVVRDVVEAAAGAPLAELGGEASQWDDIDRRQYEFGTLARIIESGLATPAQMGRVLQVLESVLGVEVQTFDDGIVQVTFTPVGGSLIVDTNSGRPVASSYSGDSSTRKRYVSVTPVVSDDVLADRMPGHLSTTSTTTPPASDDEPR